ncbi:hypothetical protein [Halorubrum sp. Ea8]|uniref:hypothetical protein n=1 Tax=Halorubrum sp. Ea8 TaxID=1383841 RepID=UPI000B997865|nr:hypothetical protein [Halorubrum sp. Ea8]OYR52089.1 hypothetical protein DJ74_02325 [Halorubrum sp. Ea8]
MADDGTASYCRRCGEPLSLGVIASQQRACCLNATPIAGVCPTHGPVGPHHAVDEPGERDGGDTQSGRRE